MKNITLLKMFLILLGLGFTCNLIADEPAEEPAADEKIDVALANPDELEELLEGATAEEAADIIEEIIQKIISSEKLNDVQKEYNISLFVAKAVKIVGDSRNDFAKALLAKDFGDYRLIIIAALSVGGTGSTDFITYLKELVGENEGELAAINMPQTTLTTSVYIRLLSSLELVRSIPPGLGRPPVAIPYQGQRPN